MSFNLDVEKPIIAITGSAGKTTVKSMLSSILRERWIIFESKDYHNTYQNTKDHVDQIKFIHRAAVLEYGMGFPGNISKHCEYICPNISVITNVGISHIGNFAGDVKLLAGAKSEMIKGMHPSGILFINYDDLNSRHLKTDEFSGEIFSVGIKSGGDYQAKEIEYLDHGFSFVVSLEGKDHLFYIPVLGKHNIYNALFAIGVADQLGFLPTEIEVGLRQMKSPNHRLDTYSLKDDITIIDDTVHAHPPAMKAAIDVLMQLGKGQKIALLGSMPELGDRSAREHEEIGRYATLKKIDFLFTYGNISQQIGAGALANGFPADRVNHYYRSKIKDLYQDLMSVIQPGATILVKGASGLNMYDMVCYLCAHYKI